VSKELCLFFPLLTGAGLSAYVAAHIVGASSRNEVPEVSDTALLVIDAQESFRQRQLARDRQPGLPQEQQALIDGATAKGWKIVRCAACRAGWAIFSLASGFVTPISDLKLDNPTSEFIKWRHCAFVGSPLEVFLIENGIRRLVIFPASAAEAVLRDDGAAPASDWAGGRLRDRGDATHAADRRHREDLDRR